MSRLTRSLYDYVITAALAVMGVLVILYLVDLFFPLR